MSTDAVLEFPATAARHRFARAQIHKLLASLTDVGLTLNEGGERYAFGDSQAEMQAEITVNSADMYWRALLGGSIGAAESFVEEGWHTDDLTTLLRVFARSMGVVDDLEKKFRFLRYPLEKAVRIANRNTRRGSRANIASHYDLGNDMYSCFLDPHMQYSSAIFPHKQATLEDAQEYKLKRICDELQLEEGDHLLEIGTGWGGLACYAAKHYGCQVTTTTLSVEQHKIAVQRAVDMGVAEQTTFLLSDYRDLEGQYDKIVSIEMIEAVGHEFLGEYFAKIDKLLKPGGRMLIQAITIADQRYDEYRRSVDFINRYIFPGGCLPSVSEMLKHIKNRTRLNIDALYSYGDDYADTLVHWHERFNKSADTLTAAGYDADFQRLWQFYFAYCEAGFREETINLVHLTANKQR